MSFISKPEQRNHIRYKTIDVIKFIKPIIFNDYIICKNPSTEKRNIDKIKQKVLINKKIGIPISPFSNYNSPKSRNENNIKKTKSDNISTSDSSNKTKFSRIISFSTTNINPFLIEEESKIINQKNDLNKRNNKTKSIIQTHDIFHFQNYKTTYNKYSQVKPKITHQNNKKKLGKLIFTEMNNKFYDSKISIKSSRDKSIENESTKIKQILRFWKGVMDISYPKIITNVIKTKYELNNKNKKKNISYSFKGIKI